MIVPAVGLSVLGVILLSYWSSIFTLHTLDVKYSGEKTFFLSLGLQECVANSYWHQFEKAIITCHMIINDVFHFLVPIGRDLQKTLLLMPKVLCIYNKELHAGPNF